MDVNNFFMFFVTGYQLYVITLTDDDADGGGKGIWIRNIDELSKVGELMTLVA
jgi:hypothetical protein